MDEMEIMAAADEIATVAEEEVETQATEETEEGGFLDWEGLKVFKENIVWGKNPASSKNSVELPLSYAGRKATERTFANLQYEIKELNGEYYLYLKPSLYGYIERIVSFRLGYNDSSLPNKWLSVDGEHNDTYGTLIDTSSLTAFDKTKINPALGSTTIIWFPTSTTQYDGAVAMGTGCVAGAINATAEGSYTRALGIGTHAEGVHTQAGYMSTPSGQTQQSHYGHFAHAEGGETQARGERSHAEGSGTTATGFGSHAEGLATESTNSGSHAEGHDTTASGLGSHSEGRLTSATGFAAHAEGLGTIAKHDYSHTEGVATQSSTWCQHVSGRYNADESTAFMIVGCGVGPLLNSTITNETRENCFSTGKDATGCYIKVGSNGRVITEGQAVSWHDGRTGAVVINKRWGDAQSFYPILSSKSQSGSWEVGTLANNFYFSYISDTNYNNAGSSGTSKQYYIDTNGNFSGAAAKLATARSLKVALGSTSQQSFNGSANATSIGVSGVLPIQNGGTGVAASTKDQVRLGMGIAYEVISLTIDGYATNEHPIQTRGNGTVRVATASYVGLDDDQIKELSPISVRMDGQYIYLRIYNSSISAITTKVAIIYIKD